VRHQVYGRKLSRNTNQRKALQRNLTDALFLNGQIKTTLAKAKFARSHVEKIITAAKKERLGRTRIISQQVSSEAFKKLTTQIAPGLAGKNSGYTRIIKLSPRGGDNAPMARLELVGVDVKKRENTEKQKSQPKAKVKAKSTETKIVKKETKNKSGKEKNEKSKKS